MILVTGAAGQLGSDVVLELKKRNMEHLGIDIAELDITDKSKVRDFVALRKPSCVIHCAAYTAVDKAEDAPELCMRVNADGTENLAIACHGIDIEMLYISTDYVFDGQGEAPLETDAPKNPLSVYGKSKLAGEEAVVRHLNKHYIVRTAWLFGQYGSNFVKNMLWLAETRDEINVVNDQVGSPTYAPDLAVLLCDMALSGKYGVYHITNEGFCSWAEFAAEIFRVSGNKCTVNPITTEQYPIRAVRPKNSRLSKASLDNAEFARLPGWKDALGRFIIMSVVKNKDAYVELLQFETFSTAYLELSWKWLNDPELKSLTDTPAFTKEQQLKWYDSLPGRTDYYTWGIALEGTKIGVVGLKNITNHQAEFFTYIGEKAYWGKGLGVKILSFAEKYACEELGLKTLTLKVLNGNTRAFNLYRRYGFSIYQKDKRYSYMSIDVHAAM